MTLGHSTPAAAVTALRGVTYSWDNMTCTVYYRGSTEVGSFCTEYSTGDTYCDGEVPAWVQAVCNGN
jgi:hypothetical protein